MARGADAFVNRWFDKMGFRPFWLTAVACLCLIVYRHHGGRRGRPEWFLTWCQETTGIENELFHNHGWSHISAFVVLMIVPLILCKLGGMGPLDLGMSIGKAKKEFLLVLGLWAAFLPVVWYLSGTEAFNRTYPRLPEAETDFDLFLAYEGFYLLKWVAWEFFFRGFMLFAFKKDFGTRAVLISTIPFVLMHFGKPEAEVLASLAAGFILCWIALRSKSIWPGVLLHWLVATSMDFFASTWWR